MKETILPFPICCCALVMVILVSLGTAQSTSLQRSGTGQPATSCSRAGIFGEVEGRLEQDGFAFRGFLASQNTQDGLGIGSDRAAHWNSPERLSLLQRAQDTFR